MQFIRRSKVEREWGAEQKKINKKRDEKVHRMGDSSYNEEKKKKTVKKQSV